MKRNSSVKSPTAIKPGSLFGALEYLKLKGLVYEVVMAFDRSLLSLEGDAEGTYLDPEASPIFHLHGKVRRVGKPAEELGVSHMSIKIAHANGQNIFSKDGKVDDAYVLVSQPGTELGVAGLFRLRHRVRNEKNRGVSVSWGRLTASEREYREWLAELLADEYSVDVENIAQHSMHAEKSARVAALRHQRN